MSDAWWEKYQPLPQFDIRRLRSSELSPRDRFETVKDVKRESRRSEAVLRRAGQTVAAQDLNDCRNGCYRCCMTYCPICARRYRVALIAEELRLLKNYECASIAVVLLAEAPTTEIDKLDPKHHEQWLRKRLSRGGFDKNPVIAAFEIVYKAKTRKWVLHVNVCAFGCDDADVLQKALNPGTRKGIECAPVEDPAKQLSYVPKFTTYHRPYKRTRNEKSKAVPLNDPQHYELVSWMRKREFSDFMLLANARRRSAKIEPSTKLRRPKI